MLLFLPSFPVGNTAATYYSYTKSTPKSLNNSNCNKNNIADACVHHTGLYKVTLLILETRSVGQFICPPLVTCFLAPVTVVLISLSLAREEHRCCDQERYTAASEHAPAVHHSYDPV